MKKIIIDARIIDSSTGIYIQRLLHFLNKNHSSEFEFVILVPQKSLEKWASAYSNLTVAESNEGPYSLAEQTSFVSTLKSHAPDLVHFTMPQQPFLWIKPAVTTIHDLTLVRFDNIDINPFVYKVKKAIFVSLLRAIMARSKAVIAPTHYVKQDIVDYFGAKYESKIIVTHEAGVPVGIDPEVMPQFENKRFIFSVNNAFPYKNIKLIIDGFAVLKKNHPDLILLLAGKKDFFYGELEKYVEQQAIPDVHFLGFISDGEKRWYYNHAQAYVSASLSEGFNISLLEAMYENCPAVISNASCHPEVGGDAALYFDPHSVDSLVEKLDMVLTQSGVREDLIKKGKKRVTEFSWERMAEETVAVYKKSLGE
ncbi:MAG: glycosyltransferase family 1 protein [Candidatus Saccharimonadales bacterium]